MNDRSDGYITELGYTHGYYRELSPLRARLALLKAGLPAPGISTACELGFGQGISLTIHAVASSVLWYGNDFNPEHLAAAKDLVTAADVDARLYQDSFAAFAERRDLPDFDYIVLNGVWSWVSAENRKSIVDFVRRRLKVGGVFFISYNTLPGWAPHMPLRALLAEHASLAGKTGAPLLHRIEGAIEFAERLLAAAPAYFGDNPGIAERLARIQSQDRRYVAHEYFNDHFYPMHFSTVASFLAPAQLSYVGSADIGELEAVYLDRSQRAVLQAIDDPVFQQVVHDFLVNRFSRRDFWIRGPIQRLGDGERAESIRRTRVIAIRPRPQLPVKLRAVLALTGTGPAETIYRPILGMLADLKPLSLGTIEQSLKPAGATLGQILDAVLLIAGQGQIDVVQDEETIARAGEHTAKFNAHLLEMLRLGSELTHLASPVTGTGVRVGRLQQLCLLALRSGLAQPEAWAELARNFPPRESADKSSAPADWPSDGSPSELIDQACQFAKTELPLLRALRIA